MLIGGKSTRPNTVVEFGAGELIGRIQEKGEGGRKGIVVFEDRPDLKETLYRLGTGARYPPYIHRDEGALPTDHLRYQTVYARHEGAVAAPDRRVTFFRKTA